MEDVLCVKISKPLNVSSLLIPPNPDPDVPQLHPHGREDVVCKEWVENIGDCPRWVGTPD